MATRTFIGGNMNLASSWAENAVPVAGDDVVIPATAGNGYLSADLPSSGQLRSFIVDDNYTGTIAIGDYKLALGSVAFTDDMLKCGANSQWSCNNGYLLVNAIASYNNQNLINLNNANFNVVNLVIAGSSWLALGGNCYINNLSTTTPTGFGIMSGTKRNMYIYGNVSCSNSLTHANFATLSRPGFNNVDVYLMGNNNTINGGYYMQNSNVYVNGNYLLNGDLLLHTINNTNVTYKVNGTLNTSNYRFSITIFKADANSVSITIDINNVDYLEVVNTSNQPIYFKNLTVNKFLSIISNLLSHVNRSKIISAETGNAMITLGNNANYCLYGSRFENISFNKPVTAFKSSITNCNNIKVIDYPNVYKNIQ